MLIDKDSKPKDTILYLSAQLLDKLKRRERIKIANINDLYREIDEKQALFKFNLSLNFLFLVNKVIIEGGELIYVPNGTKNQ